MRFSGEASFVGAMKSGVFSVQYAENSTRDWVDRIKAGAVRDARSPLNDAIDYILSALFSVVMPVGRAEWARE